HGDGIFGFPFPIGTGQAVQCGIQDAREAPMIRKTGRRVRAPIERLEMRLLLHEGADVPNLVTVGDFNAYADQETAERRESFSPGPIVLPTVASGLPQLSSLPGAPTAIFLDFDGDTTTATNAYTEDADPTTFNAAEQASITEAWRQMSIYFAIFDVNVTTI